MYIRRGGKPAFVTLGDGRIFSRSDLPSPATRRWVASRKGRVVVAVESGLMAFEEACEVYGLSEEELESWMALARRHGTAALKSTSLQKYRQPKVE